MAKTKKLKTKKKIPGKKKTKKVGTPRHKKNKPESAGAETIFDSKVGKTDALFVDNPKEDIDEIIKEFDSLPENQIESSPAIANNNIQQDIVPENPKTSSSIWKSLMGFLFKRP